MQGANEVENEREVDGIPVSALAARKRRAKYGRVPGLDDEELADPDELERQAYMEEFGPVLALPVDGRESWRPWPTDGTGGLDWGAFGTVDFARTMPEFDKATYKADRLREKLKDVLIMLSIVKERLPGNAKYVVLKHLKMGVIELEHITNEDMLGVAQLYLRARRLQQEIAELEEASRARKQREVAAVLS